MRTNDTGFCVYQHVRLDTGTPFYVGKGRLRRAFEKRADRRNSRWVNIAATTSYRVEVVEENLSEGCALNLERRLIAEYREKGWAEANIADGGCWSRGTIPWNKGKAGVYTKEHRSFLSDQLKKEHPIHTKESKAKSKLARKGRKLSASHKQSIAKTMRGYVKTKEHRLALGKSLEGRKVSDETKEQLSKAHAKPITLQVYKQHQLIGTWYSRRQCLRDLNLNKVGLNRALRGVLRSYKGYTFRVLNKPAEQPSVVG